MKIGPGMMVTAAFIGPGTLTTASLAGAQFGFALVWALVFSIVATWVLQEMCARLGLVGGHSLSAAIAEYVPAGPARLVVVTLVVLAIGAGNAAYQTGNILGASVGASELTGLDADLVTLVIVFLASGLLLSGAYRLIEAVLILLVGMMSIVFLATMLASPPDVGMLLSGLMPQLPDGAALTAIALVGTTVVPYNLFLHAQMVREKWREQSVDTALGEARTDLSVSVLIGGLITLAIMSTAVTAFASSESEFTLAALAGQLEPLLGAWAGSFVSAGLFAAGLTSAMTAPLAAGIAICGLWQKELDIRSPACRLAALMVMVVGGAVALLDLKPVQAIVIAQATNGVLLPVVAIILLWLMNRPSLGYRANNAAQNALGGLIVAVMVALGGYRLVTAFT